MISCIRGATGVRTLRSAFLQRTHHTGPIKDVDVKFENGFFRFHNKNEFICSYFTPLTAICKELRKHDHFDSDEIKIRSVCSEDSNPVNSHSLLGDAFVFHRDYLVEYSDNQTLRLKFKGLPEEIAIWNAIEFSLPSSKEIEEKRMKQLKIAKDNLMQEFQPLFDEYKAVIEKSKYYELLPNFFFAMSFAGLCELIFRKIGWDIMEPITWAFATFIGICSTKYFFMSQAHYVSCGRKLRLMRIIQKESRKRNLDLNKLKKLGDQLFRIEDDMNQRYDGHRLKDTCAPLIKP